MNANPITQWRKKRRHNKSLRGKWRPFYKTAKKYLTMPDDHKHDVPGTTYRRHVDDDGISWIEKTIAWDNAHRVRYRLWRAYANLSDPKGQYYSLIYWPIRTFYQRGRRGWAVRDTWSVDHYLSTIIPEMMDYLAQHGHGHPSELTPDEWDNILIDIANGFRAHKTLVNLEYLPDGEHYDKDKFAPVEEELLKTWKRGAKLFVKWYGGLWD